MGKNSLPPGFRFHPTHVELIMYYLKRKVRKIKLPLGVISELDIYRHAPWHLPDKSCLKSRDLKWYFFCPRERKYASGQRMNRATEDGYWKSTGRDRSVNHNNQVVGQIKTLTFFTGKPPKGTQTDWVMHEYRYEEKDLSEVKDSYVLCVIFQKDGPGPRNGAQYGAPFIDEEWDDDGIEEVGSLSSKVDPSAGPSMPSLLPPNEESQSSLLPGMSAPQSNVFGGSSESHVLEKLPSSLEESLQIVGGEVDSRDSPPNLNNDYTFSIEEFFPDENLHLNNGDGNQMIPNEIHGTVTAKNDHERNNIYKDLEDLDSLAVLNGGERATDVGGQEALYNFDQMLSSDGEMYNWGQMLPCNNLLCGSDEIPFLELNDLDAPLSYTAEGLTSNLASAAYPPFIPTGAENQNFSTIQYQLPHNSNDQDQFGFPERQLSAFGQSSWQDNVAHHNSNEGYSNNGYKAP